MLFQSWVSLSRALSALNALVVPEAVAGEILAGSMVVECASDQKKAGGERDTRIAIARHDREQEREKKKTKQALEPTRRSARLRGEAAAAVPAPGGQKRKAASSAQRKPGKAAKTE